MPFNSARILMCSPAHFSVSYEINPWMDTAQWEAREGSLHVLAGRQWLNLHDTLEYLGAKVELVEPVDGLPDLVFTANAATIMNGKAVLARFRHNERRGEEPVFEQALERLVADGVLDSWEYLPAGIRHEGAGDAVWDKHRNRFWVGYGPRSDYVAAAALSDAFGVDAQPMHLVDPRFYHMDTALSVLPRGELMYVPCAFNADGLGHIRAAAPATMRIELSEADACQLAANAVCLGDDIVLSRCSPELRETLERRGYRVHEVGLTAFLLSGGSAFCLTLRLDWRCAVTRQRTGMAAAAE